VILLGTVNQKIGMIGRGVVFDMHTFSVNLFTVLQSRVMVEMKRLILKAELKGAI
jgi:hypothetical protein